MFSEEFDKTRTIMYVIFRIVVGGLFFLNGASKFGIIGTGNVQAFSAAFGLPVWLGFVVAFVEMIGGILIVIGLLTRFAAIAGAVDMLCALMLVHFSNGINILTNGGQLAVLFLMCFLILISFGGRKISIEQMVFKKEL